MKKRSIPDAAKADWSETGSFMNKPKNGWCHREENIAKGVTYNAMYVGCVKILQSVKSVSLEDRSNIIKIATARCCDKAGFVKYKKKHKIPQTISKAFGDVFTGYRGECVLITISKSSIKIVLERTGVLICDHYIENISFASGGEKEYSSFVSYIAKDNVFERACFVIECEMDIKHEVIQTIGQAFEAKYKDFMKKPLKATEIPEKFSQPIFPADTSNAPASQPGYASLQKEDGAVAATYSKLQDIDEKPGYTELKGAGATNRSIESNPYSHLERKALPAQNIQMDYDKLSFDTNIQSRPSNIPVVAGANYDEIPGGKSDFAAVYDNPIASPTTKEKLLIDFNDNTPEYQSISSESPYDNPKDLFRAKQDSSPYDNPKDLKAMQLDSDYLNPQTMPSPQYDQPRVQNKQWESFVDTAEVQLTRRETDKHGYMVPRGMTESTSDHAKLSGSIDATTRTQVNRGGAGNHGYMVPTGVTQSSAKYASLHHKPDDDDDSTDYHPPEEVADYQRPKSSEYQPPNTHYQSPPNINAGRPKSVVGPLDNKPWFHGNISRIDSEMLIENDGEFLVRESSSTQGQYVLSGMKDGQHRHLLLVDPQGQVRTKDRTFATVEDLINYHRNNNIPIISGGSDVHIVTPVQKKQRHHAANNSFKI